MSVKRWAAVARRSSDSPGREAGAAPASVEPPTPSLWAAGSLGFQPDPRQAEVLDAPGARVILCCSRQWGKSTLTAIRALHYAWFHPDSLVVCIAPAKRQSRLFIHKIERFLRARLEAPIRRDPRDPLSLRLPNGSAIIGLPARDATTRGFDGVNFLIFEEAAFVPDAAWISSRPFLATTNGALWLLSTPNGESGFFFHEWHDAGADWTRLSVPATGCPRISRSFLDSELRALGPHHFAQEYLCEFLPSRHQLIPRHLLDAAITESEYPLLL